MRSQIKKIGLLLGVIVVPSVGLAQTLFRPGTTLQKNIEGIYTTSLKILPIIVFLVFLYAGYLYITSIGNEAKITEAKNWIYAALGGLILLILIPLIMQALGLT